MSTLKSKRITGFGLRKFKMTKIKSHWEEEQGDIWWLWVYATALPYWGGHHIPSTYTQFSTLLFSKPQMLFRVVILFPLYICSSSNHQPLEINLNPEFHSADEDWDWFTTTVLLRFLKHHDQKGVYIWSLEFIIHHE